MLMKIQFNEENHYKFNNLSIIISIKKFIPDYKNKRFIWNLEKNIVQIRKNDKNFY